MKDKLQQLIEWMEEEMEINQEFITAVEPLVEYLRKNKFPPNSKIIISQERAELVYGIYSTGIAFDGTLPQSEEQDLHGIARIDLIKWLTEVLSGEKLTDEQARLVLEKYKNN